MEQEESEKGVRRESNKNMVDLLRSTRGESKTKGNREVGHSKDF